MFLKTNEIKGAIVYTSELTEEEYRIINEILNNLTLVYLIPYDQEEPTFILDNDITFKDSFSNRIFSYKSMIQKIVNETGLNSSNFIVIAKNIKIIKQFLSQPIGTVLISNGSIEYEDIGHLPDIKLGSFENLKVLNKSTGFFSEVCSTLITKDQSYSNSGFIFNFKVERDDYIFEVVAGGRYFNTKHECYNSHQLSHRINKSKYDQSQNKIFRTIYVPIIQRLMESTQIDGITRVPSRPSKSDRLKTMVQIICKDTKLDDFSDKIICPVDYPSHKNLSKDLRFENVSGKFKVTEDVSGKNIVIIDDVFTTGATVYECVKQFYKHGAEKVTVVVLGVNQFPNEFPQRTLFCKECDGEMHLKFNSYKNTTFYGCENFKTENCLYSEDFIPGWNRIIAENQIKFDSQYFDFEDDEILF